MGTGELSGEPDKMLGGEGEKGTCGELVSHQGGVAVLLVASC